MCARAEPEARVRPDHRARREPQHEREPAEVDVLLGARRQARRSPRAPSTDRSATTAAGCTRPRLRAGPPRTTGPTFAYGDRRRAEDRALDRAAHPRERARLLLVADLERIHDVAEDPAGRAVVELDLEPVVVACRARAPGTPGCARRRRPRDSRCPGPMWTGAFCAITRRYASAIGDARRHATRATSDERRGASASHLM